MALDHIGLNVTDFAVSRTFYVGVLSTLGLYVLAEGDGWAMMGRGEVGCFWFGVLGAAPGPLHIAFSAMTREQVCRFHRAGIGMNGRDNGAPGVRAEYGLHYYAAYLLDPDGHNLEAVCRSS